MTADLKQIEQLLKEEGLCYEDISDHEDDFVIVRNNDGIVGFYAIEKYPPYGLLRSVVVASSMRGSGVGQKLVEQAKWIAGEIGIRELFLLTESAPDFFEKLGFERTERKSAPPSIQETVEFKTFCPDSAVCMKYSINE